MCSKCTDRVWRSWSFGADGCAQLQGVLWAGVFQAVVRLLSMASHVILKDRLLLLSSQHSRASYVRAVAVVWWIPRGSAFPSEPLFLQESEIAELKLLNKPDWIQGSRSGSPLCLPQKRGEEKFLWVLQGIVWLVGERKARQGFLIPSLLFLPVKGLKDIIVFFLWFMFLNYSLVFRCGSLSANATEMKIKTSQWTSSWDDLHLRK